MLFFLAFLPQFVRSEGELPIFGAVFFALALAADIAYCFAANAIGPWLRRRSAGHRVTGSIYFGLGFVHGHGRLNQRSVWASKASG